LRQKNRDFVQKAGYRWLPALTNNSVLVSGQELTEFDARRHLEQNYHGLATLGERSMGGVKAIYLVTPSG
jgi:hypothetical protein